MSPAEAETRSVRRAAVGVFLIAWASFAFFWPSRDWNSASRLMLVYAVGDRGTVAIDGLDQQTGDKSRFGGHTFSDKPPGFALTALPAYLAAKAVLRLPPHPLGQAGMARWPADYWVTLGSAGLLAAATAAGLVLVAARLGCRPRRAAFLGLVYAVATPVYVYATMAYAHAVTAFALFCSFSIVVVPFRSGWPAAWAVLAGFLGGWACLCELSVAPVVALFAGYVLFRPGVGRSSLAMLGAFVAGGLVPLGILLAYNAAAFGSPFDMGYAHHDVARFRAVHSAGNPLGLRAPEWGVALPLLWGEFRGLLFYAPIVMLAPVGWVALARRGRSGVVVLSAVGCALVFLVNLSYPEWTGGWCTGPRLLVPMLPLAMVGVAGALAEQPGGRGGRWLGPVAAALALAGAFVVGVCLGVGGRMPDRLFDRPLLQP